MLLPLKMSAEVSYPPRRPIPRSSVLAVTAPPFKDRKWAKLLLKAIAEVCTAIRKPAQDGLSF